MDRNETVRISRLAAFGGLTISDISRVIIQYCIEHGKSHLEVDKFIHSILYDSRMIKYCFDIALDFYERKFAVYKLWSTYNPLNNLGQERTLLQIF